MTIEPKSAEKIMWAVSICLSTSEKCSYMELVKQLADPNNAKFRVLQLRITRQDEWPDAAGGSLMEKES